MTRSTVVKTSNDPVYFVYIKTHGNFCAQKWYGDQTKGDGRFQKGEVGKSDIVYLRILEVDEIDLTIEQLKEKYPCEEGYVKVV